MRAGPGCQGNFYFIEIAERLFRLRGRELPAQGRDKSFGFLFKEEAKVDRKADRKWDQLMKGGEHVQSLTGHRPMKGGQRMVERLTEKEEEVV